MEPLENFKCQYVFVDENGKIENQDQEKVYFVSSGTTLKIIFDCEPAILIANLPHLSRDGKLTYTMTEPFQTGITENQSMIEKEDPEYHILTSFSKIKPTVNEIGAQSYEINLLYPGVFFFQFKFKDDSYTEPQWIQVDPDISYGKNNLNVSSLRILTVLTRSCGKIDQWEDFIITQKNLGYNAIHFTPIQKYGESMSHYSLADQLDIDNWFFENKQLTTEEKFDKLKYHINKMQIESNMLFFIDIVLNHTAGNSEWIKEHPEATYNTDNCPHLMCAYVLDKALTDFDIKFSKGETPEFPYAPYLKTEENFEDVMNHIRHKIIAPLKLEEYFYL